MKFNKVFEIMIGLEGGFKLHTVPGDRGGQTYAGISRNRWPQWPGWLIIDAGHMDDPTRLTELVRKFYKEIFWDTMSGDEIDDFDMARSIFCFRVNAGRRTAAKLAQIAVGALPDGAIGPKTLKLLNSCDPKLFVPVYALLKISRYAQICTKDRSQKKFLLGWINRALKGI